MIPARHRRVPLLLAALGGGALGALLGGVLVTTHVVRGDWLAGLLIAIAGVLVGGFVGAMLTRTVELPPTSVPASPRR